MATVFKSVRLGSDNVDYSAADAAALAAATAASRGFRGKGNGAVTEADADNIAVLDDAGKVIYMDRATAQTATIPPNSSVAFVVDQDVLTWRQVGAGAFTVTAGSGVTLVLPPGKTAVSNGAGAVVSALKVATNTWHVYGDLVPS